MIDRLPPPFVEDRPPDMTAELAALQCLRVCLERLGLSRVPLPVPVERWIEHPLGYDFGFEAMTGMIGFAEPRTGVIRINGDITDERRIRWTAAHELGHVQLANEVQTGIKFGDPRYALLYENATERQAERFAAAFLMPIEELVHAFFDISREHHLDPGESLVALMCRTEHTLDLWANVYVPALSRRFDVTPAGVLFRLGELRLSDRAPMILPRHLVLLDQRFTE